MRIYGQKRAKPRTHKHPNMSHIDTTRRLVFVCVWVGRIYSASFRLPGSVWPAIQQMGYQRVIAAKSATHHHHARTKTRRQRNKGRNCGKNSWKKGKIRVDMPVRPPIHLFYWCCCFFLFAQCDRRRFLLSLLCGVVVSRHHQHPEWIWIVWGIIVLYKWRMSKLVKLGIIRNGGRIMYTTRKGTHDGDGWRWQRIKPSGK